MFLVLQMLLVRKMRVGVLIGLQASLQLGLLAGLQLCLLGGLGLTGGVDVGELLGVGAEVAEQLAELVRGQEHLGEAGEASILLNERMVLCPQETRIVRAVRELTLEPSNVFCEGKELVIVESSIVAVRYGRISDLPFLRPRNARADTLFRSCRRSWLLSFLPSSLAKNFSSSSISSSDFCFLAKVCCGRLFTGVYCTGSDRIELRMCCTFWSAMELLVWGDLDF